VRTYWRIKLDFISQYAYLYAHIWNENLEKSSRAIVKLLLKDGFVLVSVAGSHHKFKKLGLIVTIPHPKKDLPIGTVRNIYKQAGWL
jgi:predicted RNA binding protein YcfA (HicA-like mRNA interferase family)